MPVKLLTRLLFVLWVFLLYIGASYLGRQYIYIICTCLYLYTPKRAGGAECPTPGVRRPRPGTRQNTMYIWCLTLPHYRELQTLGNGQGRHSLEARPGGSWASREWRPSHCSHCNWVWIAVPDNGAKLRIISFVHTPGALGLISM